MSYTRQLAHKLRSAGLGAALLVIGVGSLALADAAWKTVTGYRSPYRAESFSDAGEPLTRRVVLIVLDGVRVDAAERMDNLQALLRRGAGGVLEAELPSLSRPARATFVTGARPEVHGVMTNGRHEPPPIPSLFSLARKQGVHTAVAGDSFWLHAFPGVIDSAQEFDKELPESTTRDSEPIRAWQRWACDRIVPFLVPSRSGLLVAGVTSPDAAGHDFGGESDIYDEAVREADVCVGRLVSTLDDGATTFVVVSDHGHIQRRGHGGHGGTEPEVRLTPLVMAGPGVAASAAPLKGRHTDVASTIAVLLGLPLPALSEGRPLTSALMLPPEQRAALEQRVERQQQLLAETLPDPAEAAARERAERTPTAWGLGLVVLAAGVFSFVRLSGPAWRKLAAIAVFVAAYAAAFWALGLQYSLSAVVKEEYLNFFFLKNLAAAAIGFAAAALWARRELLWLGLLLQCLLAVRVVWTYGDSGLFLETYLPNLDASFRTYLDLLAIFAVGASACLAAGVRGMRKG